MNWRKYVNRGFRIACAKAVGWVADQLEEFHDWIVWDMVEERSSKFSYMTSEDMLRALNDPDNELNRTNEYGEELTK